MTSIARLEAGRSFTLSPEPCQYRNSGAESAQFLHGAGQNWAAPPLSRKDTLRLSSSCSSFAAANHSLLETFPLKCGSIAEKGKRGLTVRAQELCGIAGTSKWGDRTAVDLAKVVEVQRNVFLG
jgi:hypothetical protein